MRLRLFRRKRLASLERRVETLEAAVAAQRLALAARGIAPDAHPRWSERPMLREER